MLLLNFKSSLQVCGSTSEASAVVAIATMTRPKKKQTQANHPAVRSPSRAALSSDSCFPVRIFHISLLFKTNAVRPEADQDSRQSNHVVREPSQDAHETNQDTREHNAALRVPPRSDFKDWRSKQTPIESSTAFHTPRRSVSKGWENHLEAIDEEEEAPQFLSKLLDDTTERHLSPAAQKMQQDARARIRTNKQLTYIADEVNKQKHSMGARACGKRRVESDRSSLEMLERVTAKLQGCPSPFRPTLWRKPSRQTASSVSRSVYSLNLEGINEYPARTKVAFLSQMNIGRLNEARIRMGLATEEWLDALDAESVDTPFKVVSLVRKYDTCQCSR